MIKLHYLLEEGGETLKEVKVQGAEEKDNLSKVKTNNTEVQKDSCE